MTWVGWALTAVPAVVGAGGAVAGRLHRVEGSALYLLSGVVASLTVFLAVATVEMRNPSEDATDTDEVTYNCAIDVVILEDGTNACAPTQSPHVPSMEEVFADQTVLSGTDGDDRYPWAR